MQNDMYPLYWTPSKEGIFMRYSFEFKLECIDKYRNGLWPNTPEGIKQKQFHDTIREWVRIEDALGVDALKHRTFNKEWTIEEKLELISRVFSGESVRTVAYSIGVAPSVLRRWVAKYKEERYNGLIQAKKGRPCKGDSMKKKTNPLPLGIE